MKQLMKQITYLTIQQSALIELSFAFVKQDIKFVIFEILVL